MNDLKGKVAIVTGGGQGIGKAISLRLAAEGCLVAIFDLRPEAAEETAQLARSTGGSAKVYAVDVGIKGCSECSRRFSRDRPRPDLAHW